MRRQRLWLGVLLAAALGVAAATTATASTVAKPKGKPLYIGLDGALTGVYSAIGGGIRNGAQAAVAELNSSGGLLGRPVVLDVNDDGSSPSQAVIITQKFASDSKYAAMIGTGFGSAAVPASKVASAAKLPYVSESAASAQVYPPQAYVYIVPPTSRLISYSIGAYLRKAGLKKAFIYHDPTAYPTEFVKYSKEYQGPYGLSLEEQTFGLTQTDFTSDLTKVKNSGAQALVVVTTTPAAAAIVKQAKQLGVQQKLILTAGNATPIFLEPACPDANGAILNSTLGPISASLPDSNPVKGVAQKVNKALGAAADQFAYDGYDAMMIIAQAIKTAKSVDRAKINDAIEHMTFIGGTAIYHFGKNRHSGMGVEGLAMAQIKDCKLVPLAGENLTGRPLKK
jgi:branched-chain amino acid transport system substrate-binding protein